MRRPHGTREWLGALYDRHAAGLYRYAVMILADTEAAILEAMSARDDLPDDRLAVQAALLALPADQREAVHLKVFEGLTFQEIASLTGESINTIASRYRYALEKMRAVL